MRATKTRNGLKVYAVAGTYVVMLGFDLPLRSCRGLRGFSIHRADLTDDEAKYLEGMKAFAETDPGFPAGATYSTKDQPIQSFQWSDYSAKPGHKYTYTVRALKGTPKRLEVFAETAVDITTESPEGGSHDVYFNRGVAASQEYARRFGDRAPDKVANNQAFIWLSRGLYEALEQYVRTCKSGDKLRVAAYEFHYEPFLTLLGEARARGVDVQVVFDARQADPGDANAAAIAKTGIGAFCTPRKNGKSYISHNKFIVKMRGEKAVSVWTGGTNFSIGGIFGHSNVGHLVEEPKVAERYLDYWKLLVTDPLTPAARDAAEMLSPLPNSPPPKGTSVIFSPRHDLSALDYYAQLAKLADDALFMTFAFGINKLFKDVYRTARAPFRMALLEKATRPMKEGPARQQEEQEIQQLRNMPENTFAIGDFIRTNAVDGWLKERLTGLNSNVRYVHNKFMLIDPLSNDPVVIAGSANFSDASTGENDENMIIVRGNKRVADIYFGEFMRLYSHHAFRESLKWRDPDKPPKPLELGDWWKDYFGNTARSVRRRYFARSKR